MKIWMVIALLPAVALGGDSDSGIFHWIEGCWSTPDKSSLEVWVIDNEVSLSGFAVTLANHSVRFYELLRIQQDHEGSWAYIAHPSGQVSTTFKAADIGDSSVLFVNADHDYPQEIRYQRDGNRLLATISSLGGGDARSFAKYACSLP